MFLCTTQVQALNFTPQQASALAILKQAHSEEMEGLRTVRQQLCATLQVPSMDGAAAGPTATS